MKTILKSLLVVAVLFTCSTTYANINSSDSTGKSSVENMKTLPVDASKFINTYFHHEDVNGVNVTAQGYNVALSDGSSITFDQYGQWSGVEAPTGEQFSGKLLKGLLPKKALDYISKNQKQNQVTSITFDFDKGFSVSCGQSNTLNFTKTGRLN
ncbi:MAG: PepSY-like domain-containing protein [Muribaculaceae bacterium]